MSTDLNLAKNFAVVFIFVVLFGTAALDKFKTLKTPSWFVKQFDGTLIEKLPGGAAAGYWVIGFFELLLTILLVMSLFAPALLPIALVMSLFLFGILCFGLRLAADYQGSANMFIYFAAALISLVTLH